MLTTFTLHHGDLPANIDLGTSIAIDTETLGLNLHRDRLCMVQISDGQGHAHLIHFAEKSYAQAINLKKILANNEILKIFHFARFDLASLQQAFGILCQNIYCTKIASNLTRTFTDRHGLKDLTRDLLGIELDKSNQTSDWANPQLSPGQLAYAASDVWYLHDLKNKLDELLIRENRQDIAQTCFNFLPQRAMLDLLGFDWDIFAHKV